MRLGLLLLLSLYVLTYDEVSSVPMVFGPRPRPPTSSSYLRPSPICVITRPFVGGISSQSLPTYGSTMIRPPSVNNLNAGQAGFNLVFTLLRQQFRCFEIRRTYNFYSHHVLTDFKKLSVDNRYSGNKYYSASDRKNRLNSFVTRKTLASISAQGNYEVLSSSNGTETRISKEPVTYFHVYYTSGNVYCGKGMFGHVITEVFDDTGKYYHLYGFISQNDWNNIRNDYPEGQREMPAKSQAETNYEYWEQQLKDQCNTGGA